MRARFWLVLVVVIEVSGCHRPTPIAPSIANPTPEPALPLDRIEIVGASVSAGFGGTPFGDAFTTAAPRSLIESDANVMLFRDPIGETAHQLQRAEAFHPTVVIALDLLFWDVYGSTDPAWRARALDASLDGLDRVRRGGAWIVLGDVPLITTAAEWILAKELVPAPADLAAINAKVSAWAKGRERVMMVPLAAWTEPLRSGGSIALAPNEVVDAKTLVAPDGLHANALGTWYLLDRLDHLIETTLPGTRADALAFKRP